MGFMSRLNSFNEPGTTKNHHSCSKGQAAMEFLMTYGWAILVVIIAVSALYYLGIFGKGSSVSSCILSPGLACKDLQVTTTGIYLVVQNSLGIDITSVIIDIKSADITFTPLAMSSVLRDGETKQVFIETAPGNNIDLRKKFKGDISISYRKSGGSLSNLNQGSLTGQAESTGPVQGMVGYWKFDENSGTIAKDSSSFENNGNLIGSPQSVAGKYGSALDFGASAGKYVIIGDSNSIDIGTSDFTVAGWVKLSAISGTNAITSKTELGYRPGYFMGIDSRKIYFELWQQPGGSSFGLTAAGNTQLAQNTWYHVAVTSKRDGSAVFYLDGVVDGNANIASYNGDISNDRSLLIGESENAQNHFNGIIDEVKIFNRALSETEINQIMNP